MIGIGKNLRSQTFNGIGRRPLTVALVPTGIKMGVGISPGRMKTPARHALLDLRQLCRVNHAGLSEAHSS